ncbi:MULTISPECIES: zinc-binding dehydrogenase [Pelosinus]|jgi:threonine dehydrogenase-like Zn-dependent dehydrogenase|uniref:Alcohol dehydrogenase zinc-binding domain protein n=1 Tax=Pelosinus fermentans B4 TaxID=1149862 RepID=I9L842_9FIRM|nr:MULTISPECIES: zinc-binding dehydrogenase [Pelosinus]MDF2570423.1 alcohol dehydrogenase [Sporomusa sp.]EIW16426.1 Alcohol dehydrogenase zinc-binding domain protein [Pelosinus fermentans B4]EIW22593.1 Alcohol dehydrogenase zinc-binding domain protein [Pelosinus fermentans A11]OAM95733.1 Alcohol dehydrogenase zinc-binding domain protein [Pelosinus fermentans DSM 17108]SDR32165.1 Zinc-binding dehydrogenase [Pelosinus fermentans]
MIEINDYRLELAKTFDVDYTINSMKEDLIEAVKRITDGKGADKVISANPSTACASTKYLTHVLPLSKINEGIQLTKSGEAIKVVLLPNE